VAIASKKGAPKGTAFVALSVPAVQHLLAGLGFQ